MAFDRAGMPELKKIIMMGARIVLCETLDFNSERVK